MTFEFFYILINWFSRARTKILKYLRLYSGVMEHKRENIIHLSQVLEKELSFSPVMARVYVYLLITGEIGAEFDDLVQYFNVSKSAVSNALNQLQARQMVHYKTLEGQRKRHFFVDLDAAHRDATSTKRVDQIADFYDEIQETRGEKDAFCTKLSNLSLLCRLFSAEIPIIVERWKQLIKQNKTSSI